MLEPKMKYSETMPQITQDLGNGNWYYNYDIKQQEIFPFVQKKNTDSPIKSMIYNYIQVKLSGKPEYKKCVELIIREFITQTQEFDLINSANKAILSGDKSSEDIVKYKEYLDKVEEIKEKVAKDLGK